MLCDSLVFGIADGVVRQLLLAEKSLTFEAAYDLDVMAEVAAKQQKDTSNKHSEESEDNATARVSTTSKDRGRSTKTNDASRCHRCLMTEVVANSRTRLASAARKGDT